MTRFDVVGTGFTVLDRIYAGDAIRPLEELGGTCGNVLVSLAMLGWRVAPLLSLGDDTVGRFLLDVFDRAGAATNFVNLREGRSSPVLVQHIDTALGQHNFSAVCPGTNIRFAGFQSIGPDDVEIAQEAVSGCSILFADRVSESIVESMTIAAAAGAIVYFEPSAVGAPELFADAVRLSSIVKFSSERLGELVNDLEQSSEAILVVTHGAAGLEVRHGIERAFCPAIPATNVVDTCGSGDMVSVGLIDRLLDSDISTSTPLTLPAVLPGIVAGQRLAMENCAFAGARGLFRQRGAEYVQKILKPNQSS